MPLSLQLMTTFIAVQAIRQIGSCAAKF